MSDLLIHSMSERVVRLSGIGGSCALTPEIARDALTRIDDPVVA